MAKSNFIIRGGADFSGIKRELDKTQKQLQSFHSGISKSMKIVGTIIGSLATGKLIKDSINAAMSVESSMHQLGRIMGANAGEFEKWGRTQAKAFGMAREEAFKYGAVYSNLISTFTKSRQETTQYTTELLKASAVVASATGRTMEDTMERIRSGLLGNTEAIEDLGINVNVAMLESTAAFRQFAKGRSWQQLSFQEQQQIRLMAILEQANTKYGDSLAGTVATRQMMFIATLKDIRLNLGQAFLPIYNAVLPLLNSLASKLEEVTRRFSEFTQALFGSNAQKQVKNTQQQADAVSELGDATEQAGKQAKGALAGFDEINQLSDNSSAAGTGVAGQMDVNEALEKMEEMESKVKSGFFVGLAKTINKNKDIIISALAGITTAVAAFVLTTYWNAIKTTVAGAFGVLGKAIKALFAPFGAWTVLIGLAIAAIVYLWRTNEDFRNNVIAIWDKIKSHLTKVVASITNVMTSLWNNHLSGVVAQLGVFLGKLMELLAAIFNNFILPLISYLVDILAPIWEKVFNGILRVIEKVVPIMCKIIEGIITTLKGVLDFLIGVFTLNWGKAWEGIKGIFSGAWDVMKTILKGTLNGMIGMINKFIDFWNSIEIRVPEINIPFVGTVGGFSVSVPKLPKIPMLAKGGITNGPMLAIVGDNPGGREVISPLDDLQSMIANAVVAAMQFNSNSQSGDVIIQLDGTTLARVLNPYAVKETNRIGKAMIVTT